MTKISPTSNDHPDFISIIMRIVNESLMKYQPCELYLIHIDNWFDHKWLKFSGKSSGVAPIWKRRTTVPAFTPNRVLKESYYLKKPGEKDYRKGTLKKPLHQYYPAKGSTRYYLDELTESGVFLWYSGASKTNKIGSVMVYIETQEHCDQWYASFNLKDTWKLNKTKRISPEEINVILSQQKISLT